MHIPSILLSVLACFFWGLIFVIPLSLSQFDCIDIVLGRYLIFGSFSCGLLLYYLWRDHNCAFLKFWKEAVLCAVIMNFGYYTALTLGIRFSAPSVIALIVGTAPITIGFFDCKRLGFSFSKLLFYPTLLTFIGIILTNIEPLFNQSNQLTIGQYLMGIFCGFLALGAWTWFVIFNTHFLQVHSHVSAGQWTTLIGCVTCVMAVIGIAIRSLYVSSDYLELFSVHNQGLLFLEGVSILGLICSALAFTLWNIACARLPSLLSGQLAILETVFGLFFIYILERTFPSPLEMAGILCILGGVWSALHLFHRYTSTQPCNEPLAFKESLE